MENKKKRPTEKQEEFWLEISPARENGEAGLDGTEPENAAALRSPEDPARESEKDVPPMGRPCKSHTKIKFMRWHDR